MNLRTLKTRVSNRADVPTMMITAKAPASPRSRYRCHTYTLSPFDESPRALKGREGVQMNFPEDEFDSMIFSERLIEARKKKGYDRKAFAITLGFSPSGYGAIENGTPTSISKLYAIAKKLDVSVDYLIGLTNEPKNSWNMP
ncbi:MAG: helix-turn-helix domain-containing protein [Anaerofustis sp.]